MVWSDEHPLPRSDRGLQMFKPANVDLVNPFDAPLRELPQRPAKPHPQRAEPRSEAFRPWLGGK